MKILIFFALLLAAPLWAAEPVRVTGVTDGDTIRVVRQGEQVKIRLHGIDAPEKKQPFGNAATRKLGQLLHGQNVSIEPTDIDRYGRTVALVWAGQTNVNQEMVRSGYAWVFSRYCKQSYCPDWYRDQQEAKAARRGLWHDPAPVAPWQWRRDKRGE